MRATTPSRTPNRAATEAALQRAALDLLDHNGVLAGLNLREVADEAGVNRGLVYHYFGSRRDLPRAALRTDVEQRMADFEPGYELAAPARFERFLRTTLDHRQAIVLAMLLVLDGDTAVRMMPTLETAFERQARDIDEGALLPDIDGLALHVAVSSMVYGYTALRDRLADEGDVDGDELDDRVAEMIGRLVQGLASPDTAAEGGFRAAGARAGAAAVPAAERAVG
jgi:AcrR family transcriptional regulator